MLDNVKRFDMDKKPYRQHLGWLMRLISKPILKKHAYEIKKTNMEGIKPPYLLLGNHNAFFDFYALVNATDKARINYIVAIDGFIKRELLLRLVGGICKRKFTKDLTLIRNFKTVIERGDVAMMYPEARYSLCGTTSYLPPSTGKLAKLFKVPVVTIITHGHHINSPFWNLHDNGIQHMGCEIKCIARAEEVAKLSADELNERINKAFIYDDFKWQKENKIRNTYEKRAEGLEKVLYQCSNCKKEFEMSTNGTVLKCNHCGKEWEMTEFGELLAKDGKETFTHIPDWFKWQQNNVKEEVKNGSYYFESKVHIKALPNAKGYIDVGKGTLIHNMNGFKVIFKDQNEGLIIKKEEQDSCHIEYNYLGKYGDCIDLNTLNDTFYIYPECDKFSVTKIALATEELYLDAMEKIKKS